MRIIDRDIELLQASIESYEAGMRRCLPSEEPTYGALIVAANQALFAMENYRTVIDAHPIRPLER
jgi:hypothetical protein